MEIVSAKLRCQLCDFEEPFTQESALNWEIQVVTLKECQIEIWTCQKCCGYDIDTIFTKYKERIRSGRDNRFH